MSTPSFFLAGVMQGARHGADLADQDYRRQLTEMILRHHPGAVVHDPGTLMWQEIQVPRAAVRREHAALADTPVVIAARHAPAVRELVRVFHALTDLAAECDVCVAWLPQHEPSMGTAAEMFSAHRAGRRVVAITPMRQNLAVLACTSLILPDLVAFDRWLADADLPSPDPGLDPEPRLDAGPALNTAPEGSTR